MKNACIRILLPLVFLSTFITGVLAQEFANWEAFAQYYSGQCSCPVTIYETYEDYSRGTPSSTYNNGQQTYPGNSFWNELTVIPVKPLAIIILLLTPALRMILKMQLLIVTVANAIHCFALATAPMRIKRKTMKVMESLLVAVVHAILTIAHGTGRREHLLPQTHMNSINIFSKIQMETAITLE